MKAASLLSVAILGLSTASAPAADTKGLAGVWEGSLKVRPQLEIRFLLHVKEADGLLKATLDSPDEGLYDLPVDTIKDDGSQVSFASRLLAASFEGTWNEARTSFRGEWHQRGAKIPLAFTRADPASITRMVVPKELEGLWKGMIKAAGLIDIRLVLRVEKDKGGNLQAFLDSPDQGAKGIRVSAIALQDDTLSFEVKMAGITFKGTRSKDRTSFDGQFQQAGARLPLVLRKTDKLDEVRRPQTPKPPFPYRTEDVSYPSTASGVSLAGTLTVPRGQGPFPAVILITGSGAQDRDETILSHRPFLVLADSLTRRGIAVLRVDDRGVGKSSGSMASATSEDFAADVLAGVAFLKGKKEIDPRRIGLIGHSEGATIATIVAGRSEDIALIVFMAGTGLPGDQILERQRTLIGKAVGLDNGMITKQNDVMRKIVDVLKTEKDAKAFDDKAKVLWASFLADLPEAQRKAIEAAAEAQGGIKALGSPWFRHFLSFDPRLALKQVRCPVLAINGEKDLQVPPKENLEEIQKALEAGGNTRVTTREFPGLNHLFQTSKTGSPTEYGTIEETIAPEVLKVVGDWVVERTKGK